MGLKYTIHGFQQAKLIEFGLNNDDALILSVIKEMYSSASTDHKIIKNQRYIWINYTYLIKEVIPILYPKSSNDKNTKTFKSNLMKKIKNFGDMGLIKRVTEFEKYNQKTKKNEKGKFAFVAPTKILDILSEYSNLEKEKEKELYLLKKDTLSQKKITLISKKDNPLSQKKITKILPYDDTLIKDNNNNTGLHNTENCKTENEEKNIEKPKNKKENFEPIENLTQNTNDLNQKPKKEKNKLVKELNQDTNNLNEIQDIKTQLEKLIGKDISTTFIKELINKYGLSNILNVVNKFEKIRPAGEIIRVYGFITHAVKMESEGKGYTESISLKALEQSKNNNNGKPIQATNFEQREYDDEFFESLYDNF